MSESIKPTPGPWVAQVFEGGGYEICADKQGTYGGTLTVCKRNGHSNRADEMHANARLIAEAGTVFHTTKMTPMQLLERVKELEGALHAAVDSGMVPTSSASDGGASKYSAQVHVADRIRAALAKCQGEQHG
ncbi:hypothetical protein J2W88_003959 [Acidovorax delafieldii]|uniref:Uncharacterized protein n=1 Tax=Acidovorax delafieldii TaxID=47920 RepID=A0AAJ2C226_ACIDE|nr:hypothetical protein [Acidovorax delafieldii]MDR6768655.1 hypothetical protein [Acidovorax delafieldii]MDR6837371.1 hypothetical protein [Acidovorax delafieldii]MDR7366861.1 hypothetical protein [Acidovorax delafieldii]